MNKINRLFRYYENSLDEESENLLFAELASDVEFRAEFKAFNSVAITLPAYTNSFKPSNVQKSRLFARAGYNMPIKTNTVPLETTKVAPIKGKYYQLIKNGTIQSVVASILTLFVMLYLMKDDGNIQTNNVNNSNSENLINQQNKPAIESYSSNNSKIEKNDSNPIIKYVYIDRIVPYESSIENNIQSDNLLERKQIISNSKIGNSRFVLNQFNTNSEFLTQNIDLNNFNFLKFDENYKNLDFRVEQSIPWHIPGETISPEIFNKLNNTTLRILYKVTDNLKIGVSMEQSTFFTTFENKNSDGDLYRISMQPNLTTVSGELVYSFVDFDKFIPYLQFGLGVNTAGFVLKPTLGIDYDITDYLSLYLAGNYDYFIYSHQDNWYNSQKFRLSYGISFKL
ncbi:hypothetical protein MASR1M45_11440 [Candidatus Kapaibacterium sp.]